MQSATAIEYQRLTDQLAVSALVPSASEAHGMLCGLICGGRPDAEETWLTELLAGTESEDVPVRACRESLEQVAERTRVEFTGPEIGLTPLLPPEIRPLAERALALYDWSRGFLYGLGLSGLDEKDLSEQMWEAFRDFTAITQLDLDDLDEGEESERSLMELTEFVWVAALLVYEEQGRRGEAS